MPFPQLEQKVVYDRNPLAEVNARIFIWPVLDVEQDRGAKFQRLIRSDYPFLVDDSEGVLEFVSQDGMWKVDLGRDVIGLSTTVYERWSEFRANLKAICDSFAEAYDFPAISGVHLQYLDVIDPHELGMETGTWSWTDLLSEPLHGELASPEISSQIRNTARFTEFDLDACPGSLQLTHQLQRIEQDREVFTIKSLFFHEFNGDLDNGFQQLDSFRTLASAVFRWAISDELHERLAPRVVDE